MHCFLSHRYYSTFWTLPSCTALRRGKVSNCLDHPTLKETILRVLPVFSSLRYKCTVMHIFTAILFLTQHLLSLVTWPPLASFFILITQQLCLCSLLLLWFNYFFSLYLVSPPPFYSQSSSHISHDMQVCHSLNVFQLYLSLSVTLTILLVPLSIIFHSPGQAIISGVNVTLWLN